MKQQQQLHIISFDVPYPPDYGGIIDVYYKIKTLHSLGAKIHLHCYEYGRKRPRDLNKYCESIHYYKRKLGITYAMNSLPYIVSTRSSEKLLANLLKDNYPILFEGLHTTFHIALPELKDRFKIVRTHNVEHEYYGKLHEGEDKFINKTFYKQESRKLKSYQKILKNAQIILPISQNDTEYFSKKFKKVQLLNAFHPNEDMECLEGKGDYLLYHGNLSVVENYKAVTYLVEKVIKKIKHKVIIAGKSPSKELMDMIDQHPSIILISDPNSKEMRKLILEAHIILLPTFQPTGIKLKLISSLFCGRHCIANNNMVSNTGFEKLCHIAETPKDIINKINSLMTKNLTQQMIEERKNVLLKKYFNVANGERIMQVLDNIKN